MKKSTNSPNLKSVFANIVETRERKALYDIFISDGIAATLDAKRNHRPNDLTNNFNVWLAEYESIVHAPDFDSTLKRLRNLEVAILMYRSIVSTTISIGEMKLNRSGSEKSYAFVRAPFFAPDNVKNEIRVYMGTLEDLDKTIEELKKDTKFLDLCEQEVVKAMKIKLNEHIQKMNRQ
jgi:hypothetical protein